MEELRRCEICGMETEDIYTVYDTNAEYDIELCEMCYEHNSFYCDYHNRRELDNVVTYKTADRKTICDEAYMNYYNMCDCCGGIYEFHYINYIEEIDSIYCEGCTEDYLSERIICEYHDNQESYQDNMKCTPEDVCNNEKLYFGIELEVEKNENGLRLSEMANELHDMNKDFVYEEDGSLCEGFEIISYPFTKDYMDKILAQELFKMTDSLKNNRYECNERCGYHIHVSRKGIENEVNFVALFEYFKDELFLLSKRSDVKFKQWSQWYIKGKQFTMNDVAYALEDCDSRYRAVNDDNYHTMEVRIFSGTLNIYELLARFELVYNFVQYANENYINDKLTNIPDFKTVATYKSNQYIGEYLNEFNREEVSC